MCDDEPKKVVRHPPIPDPLPTCGSCAFLVEELVDNDAGGVKGFVYYCKRYCDLLGPGGLPVLPRVTRENPACLEHHPRSENPQQETRVVALDPTTPHTIASSLFINNPSADDVTHAVKHLFGMYKDIVDAGLFGGSVDFRTYDSTSPVNRLTTEICGGLYNIVEDTLRGYSNVLEDNLDNILKELLRELSCKIYLYVQSAIADLRRELLDKKEPSDKLVDILQPDQSDEPLPEWFKEAFGLQ